MDFLMGYVPLSDEDIMEYFTDAQKYAQMPWEDRMGMKVTSGVVTLEKDPHNLVGVSIGGGSPHCPCLYVVQIFDNTPASRDGTLAAGDEIVGINGSTVKGKTKTEVARLIQLTKDRVAINYNKLHADPKQGKTLDLILKKMKHRVVEGITSSTADALGLSRAILCNDSMVKKLQELENTEILYRNLVLRAKMYLKAYLDLSLAYRAFGDVFSGIGVREPLAQASLVFSKFGETHRELEKNALELIKIIKPMMSDLNTYLSKAIPDTKLTIKKYLDIKFEYLSYCLKVKELDDEEYACNALNEYLYRVESGNYEYRLVLRCRQEARTKFAKMRNDVMVKLELLDNKRVQDLVFQLQRFVAALAKCHSDNHGVMKENQLFPIEVDLSGSTFSYNTTGQMAPDEDEASVSVSSPSPSLSSICATEGRDNAVKDRVTGNGIKASDREHEHPHFLLEEEDNQGDSSKLERDLFDFFLDSPISLMPNSTISSVSKKVSEERVKATDFLLETDDQGDSSKLEGDLFDFFLDSPISLMPNSAVSSVSKKVSEERVKAPVSSDAFGTKNGFDFFGDFSNNNNNKDFDLEDSDLPQLMKSELDSEGLKFVPLETNDEIEDMVGFQGFETADKAVIGHVIPHKIGKGENAFYITGVEDMSHLVFDSEYSYDLAPRESQFNRNVGGAETTERAIFQGNSNNNNISDDDLNEDDGDDDGDLDDDYFFEAMSSLSASDDFVKDFMHGTRIGERLDDDDGDQEMLNVSTRDDNDCALVDININDQAASSNRQANQSVSKDDILIDLSDTADPGPTAQKSSAIESRNDSDSPDSPLLPL